MEHSSVSQLVGVKRIQAGCQSVKTFVDPCIALLTWMIACRPFLLQSKASYTQIGIFSIASYPYSFKLFWSPIVDSVYSLAFGRRKSWVVPIQLGSAAILLTSATWLSKRCVLHCMTCIELSPAG